MKRNNKLILKSNPAQAAIQQINNLQMRLQKELDSASDRIATEDCAMSLACLCFFPFYSLYFLANMNHYIIKNDYQRWEKERATKEINELEQLKNTLEAYVLPSTSTENVSIVNDVFMKSDELNKSKEKIDNACRTLKHMQTDLDLFKTAYISKNNNRNMIFPDKNSINNTLQTGFSALKNCKEQLTNRMGTSQHELSDLILTCDLILSCENELSFFIVNVKERDMDQYELLKLILINLNSLIDLKNEFSNDLILLKNVLSTTLKLFIAEKTFSKIEYAKQLMTDLDIKIAYFSNTRSRRITRSKKTPLNHLFQDIAKKTRIARETFNFFNEIADIFNLHDQTTTEDMLEANLLSSLRQLEKSSSDALTYTETTLTRCIIEKIAEKTVHAIQSALDTPHVSTMHEELKAIKLDVSNSIPHHFIVDKSLRVRNPAQYAINQITRIRSTDRHEEGKADYTNTSLPEYKGITCKEGVVLYYLINELQFYVLTSLYARDQNRIIMAREDSIRAIDTYLQENNFQSTRSKLLMIREEIALQFNDSNQFMSDVDEDDEDEDVSSTPQGSLNQLSIFSSIQKGINRVHINLHAKILPEQIPEQEFNL